jgi:hypothetical protein
MGTRLPLFKTINRLTAIPCKLIGIFGFAILIACMGSIPSQAASFQFEVLGTSEEWVVLRENVPPLPDVTDTCSYPGVDPSEAMGVKVHFIRISPELKRGVLFAAGPYEASFTLYEPARNPSGCTSSEDAERNWKSIDAFGKNHGLRLERQVPPKAILGVSVPDRQCTVLERNNKLRQQCDRRYESVIDGRRMKVAISLFSVPEAPDENKCQFIGYRLGAAIQVEWLDLGTMGSGSAPGGFASHFDCRPQLFMPLRVYTFEDKIVLLISFRGNNIADREEYPFLSIFPRHGVK